MRISDWSSDVCSSDLDDLMEKAVSAEALAHRVGEAGELDAVGAHDADAAELEALGEVEDGLAVDQGREGVIRCQSADSHRQRARDPGGRNLAADDALAVIGLEPVDPRRLVRQALPDRQQKKRER